MSAPWELESDSSLAARDSVVARVRAVGGSAAIAALLLVYFGFFRLAEPAGGDLFHRAGWVFYHALRWGGVAMAAVAAASLTGRPLVLLVDALVSSLIGVLLIVTGVLMLIGGGDVFQTLLNVFCGGLFLSSAARNAKTYLRLRRTCGDNQLTPSPPRDRAAATGHPRSAKPAAGVPDRSRKNEPKPKPTESSPPPLRPSGAHSPPSESASAPPSDGFLSSMSEGGPPPRP